jgi:DNA invertase Pin-like site-specific DNA recombinase
MSKKSVQTGRLVGYARVSTQDQTLGSQVKQLTEAGVERRLIFKDTASGAKASRPGLEACLLDLEPGDVLVVCRLDRLGRSLRHLVDLVEELQKKKVGLRSLSDGVIDTTTAGGRLVFGIFSVLAEFERELIRERTRVGLDAARARGRRGGRPGYTPEDQRVLAAKSLYEDGRPVGEILRILGIRSKATLYRRLEVAGVEVGGPARREK